MDCDELVELVTAYLDGALEADTERRVLEHLGLCDGCSRYLEQVRATIEQLGRLPPPPLPDALRSQLLEAFRNTPR